MIAETHLLSPRSIFQTRNLDCVPNIVMFGSVKAKSLQNSHFEIGFAIWRRMPDGTSAFAKDFAELGSINKEIAR